MFDYFIQICQRIIEKGISYSGVETQRYVLMFHMVSDKYEDWFDEEYTIFTQSFELLIDTLIENGICFINPKDVLDRSKKGVLITFDDAFKGVFTSAFPILKSRNIPFVFFQTVDLLNKDGYLTDVMISEMINDDSISVTIGSHGISHCNLKKTNRKRVQQELVESKNKLESMCSKKIEYIAYPYGSYDAVGLKELCIAKKEYKLGFGTRQSAITKWDNHMYIPRINVNEKNWESIVCRILSR